VCIANVQAVKKAGGTGRWVEKTGKKKTWTKDGYSTTRTSPQVSLPRLTRNFFAPPVLHLCSCVSLTPAVQHHPTITSLRSAFALSCLTLVRPQMVGIGRGNNPKSHGNKPRKDINNSEETLRTVPLPAERDAVQVECVRDFLVDPPAAVAAGQNANTENVPPAGVASPAVAVAVLPLPPIPVPAGLAG
jgi:hypothetical protein